MTFNDENSPAKVENETAQPEESPSVDPLHDAPNETRDDDDIDEELLSLSGPPLDLRFALITMTVIFLSVLMLAWFYPDLSYLLKGIHDPLALGEAPDLEPNSLVENSYVTVEGIPRINRTVVFQESRFKWFAQSDNNVKMFPLAGQKEMLVQWEIPQKFKTYRDPATNPERLALPTFFEGRLVKVESLGKNYEKVWAFLQDRFRLEINKEMWVVLDGQHPGDKIWVIPVYLIFLTMIIVNLIKLRRFWRAWKA